MTQQQVSPFRSFLNTIVRVSLLVGVLLGVAVPARAYDAIRRLSPLGARLAEIARQTGQPLGPMLDSAHPWVPLAPDSATIARQRAARVMPSAPAQPLTARSMQSVDFATPRALNSGQSPSDIATGDFNTDGRADVAMVETPGGLAVMLASGGGLGPAVVSSLPARPSGVTTGDFDGDGKLDLAVTMYDAPGLAILHGNGDGTSAAAQPIPFPSGLQSVVSGDLDGDGRLDLATLGNGDSTLTVLLNAGGGAFPTLTPHAVPGTASWLVLGDFNGDNRLDVAAAGIVPGSGFNPPRALSVMLNQGGGTLGSRNDYSLSVNPWTISAGDLNGDGRDDLVISSNFYNQADVLLAGPGGAFGSPVVVRPTPSQIGAYASGVRLADLDGDGRLDLVLTYNDGDCYDSKCLSAAFFRGAGDGTFETPMVWHAGDADGARDTGALAIADITGDHVPDLVVGRRNSYTGGGTFLLPGLRAPQLVAPARRPLTTAPYAVGAGRTRPGAAPDLIASGANAVWIMRNRGNGTFADPDSFSTGAFAALEDFDHDGLQDVVIAIDATTLVRLANGAGGFAPPTTVTSGPFLAAGDFTGDGSPDLAVTLGNGNIGVLPGDGAGHFSGAVDFGRALPAVARAVRAADMDRDGRADLLVAYGDAYYEGDTLAVLWSNGAGFPAVTASVLTKTLSSSYLPSSDIQTGDFNGDGRPDVVVTRCGSDSQGEINIVTGLAGRALSASSEYRAGNDPIMATVADFDGDGLEDVAVANVASSESGRFSAFHSLGAEGFECMPSASVYGGYAVEHYATTIVAGDFDADGRVDVAVGCLQANSIISVPNISPISAPTAVVASLMSANAQPDRVSLVWSLGHLLVTSASVERSGPSSTGWSALATVNPDATGRIAYEDRDVTAGSRYGYRLRIASGNTTATSAETWVEVPNTLALAIDGARPNPTRGPLTVTFTLPTSDRARLELLDVSGRRVREHTLDAPTAGAHQVSLEERGSLAPGLYFLRLSQSARVAEARVAVVH
jgi:hypothetical protein